MPEIPEGLLTYFANREQQRHEQVAAALEARTSAERTLMKEAAVMGYVLGTRASRDEEIPLDAVILQGVVAACLNSPDLYPAISAPETTPDAPTGGGD
jgi:hypothetical protein